MISFDFVCFDSFVLICFVYILRILLLMIRFRLFCFRRCVLNGCLWCSGRQDGRLSLGRTSPPPFRPASPRDRPILEEPPIFVEPPHLRRTPLSAKSLFNIRSSELKIVEPPITGTGVGSRSVWPTMEGWGTDYSFLNVEGGFT